MQGPEKTTAVEDMLDQIQGLADRNGHDAVSVGEVASAIGGRGFGPLLFIPPLFEITPIGAVPGVPTFIALICAIFAFQLVIGRKDVWLPGFVDRMSVKAAHVSKAVTSLRGIGAWLDRHFGRRLDWFAGPKASRIAGIVILGLCLTVPPLELVPWLSSAPMLAIAFLGLAMTVRDGLLILTGFVVAGLAAITVYIFFAGGAGAA
ncbi:exopolysaccharide biosynthesis protein [Roseovarius nanhaiticus]|uniref:exopolysaccharide biosynthesis protein n=1 Tax=Roseovarius nanhaiticus TaxID=573024 RepID=UPI002493C6E3|nr:exopolysaccharide biosynthesis protein [Roseovarius nanhaiticus]